MESFLSSQWIVRHGGCKIRIVSRRAIAFKIKYDFKKWKTFIVKYIVKQMS